MATVNFIIADTEWKPQPGNTALCFIMLVAKAMTQTAFCIDALKVDP